MTFSKKINLETGKENSSCKASRLYAIRLAAGKNIVIKNFKKVNQQIRTIKIIISHYLLFVLNNFVVIKMTEIEISFYTTLN